MKITLNEIDYHVMAAYKAQEERRRGYTGPILICMERLAEIHMFAAELTTKAYFARMRTLGLSLKQMELTAQKIELEKMLISLKKKSERGHK